MTMFGFLSMNVELNGQILSEKRIFLVTYSSIGYFELHQISEWSAIYKIISFVGCFATNLADLNVYDILTTIERCQAFVDLIANTNIQAWFKRMKNFVEPHRLDAPVCSIS